jgi:phospholipase/carboxylesterase
MQHDLVIQQPDAARAEPGQSAELLLLFDGVGASARDLLPLAEALAEANPHAWVVSLQAPHPSEFGHGWQWFSVQGVTEDNRPGRVAAAMPAFLQRVAAWQARAGSTPERTTLIGFSQGAIMSLEATQVSDTPLAGRVIAIAGRFAQAPQRAPQGTAVHLWHGDQDQVMPVLLADSAHQQLQALGATASLQRFSGLGHGIDQRVLNAVLALLAA